MKKLLIMAMMILMASTAFAVKNPWDQKLPFKSGIIKYKLSGSATGEKVLYIKDYGRTTAEYENKTMKIMGISRKEQYLNITTPDWEYDIDLMEKEGSKQPNPNKYLKSEFNKLSKSDKKKLVKNVDTKGLSIIEGLNGKVMKRAGKMLGYTYDKVTALGVTVYNFTGTDIPIKVESNMLGIKLIATAQNISKSNPPSSKFKIPSNISIEEQEGADAMLQEHAKSTVQSLLEGNEPAQAPEESSEESGSFEISPDQKQKLQDMMKMFGN